MILSDCHTHTTFSDGHNTPEEMILAAIAKGMQTIGISDHSYTWFDESYCMPKERIQEYKDTIQLLKEKYRDRIQVLCGIEQDYYSDEPTDGYDYVIGSVHYIRLGDQFIPIDETPEILQKAAEQYFNGDMYRLIEVYYDTVSNVVSKTNCDIIGHVDLIQKFNASQKLFDENDDRYKKASVGAVNKLLQHNKPFEINTGAIARGYQTVPYPMDKLRNYIKENGGKTILSSDAHSTQSICFQFSKYLEE